VGPVPVVKAKSKVLQATRTWRTCSEVECAGLDELYRALLPGIARGGEFLGQHGEIIRGTPKTKYTSGMTKESRELSDVWSRSIYARIQDHAKHGLGGWECFEFEAMCTNEMITKISVGKEVPLLLEIYEPKGPEAIIKIDSEPDVVPIVTMNRPKRIGIEDETEEPEQVSVATGATRVGKNGGFGKQRSQVEDWVDDGNYEKWFIPTPLIKLTRTLGTKVVNEIRDEGVILVHSGSVVHVQEAAFKLAKPIEVQGRENDWVQTVYLKSPEGYWYCWRYRELVTGLDENAWGRLPYEFSELILQILEPQEQVRVESVSKAGHYSYKQEGKKDNQAKLFPDLMKEIEEKKAQWQAGLKWVDKAARCGAGYKAALREGCVKDGKWKIGGGPEERERFFEEVIAAYPQCFWMDGCAAPTVKNHVIEFDLKPGAKPVARQPIPLSPRSSSCGAVSVVRQAVVLCLRRLSSS
jgi:hypothetical protein